MSSHILKGALRYRARADLLTAMKEDRGSKLSLKAHPCHFPLPAIVLPTSLDNGAINVLREEPTSPSILLERSRILSNHLWYRNLPIEKQKRQQLFRKMLQDHEEHLDVESIEGDDMKDIMVGKIEKKMLEKLVRHKVSDWRPLQYVGHVCHVYMVTRLAPNFATTFRVLFEIRKRCPGFEPKSVFDFGSGLGTVSWAAQAIWPSLNEHMQVDASPDMLTLSDLLLRGGHSQREPLVPGVHQRNFLPASATTKYDLVIAGHSLLDVGMKATRDRVLETLWAKTGQFLVLIEQGTKAGFAALLEARNTLLKQADKVELESKKPRIFAPCPHHLECGKADSLCNFYVKYRRMNMTKPEEVHAKEVFSYLIMSKGPWPNYEAETTTLPRIVSYKLKSPKSAVLHDLCTPTGEVQRNVFSKSATDKTLFRFLKNALPGDLAPMEKIEEEAEELLEIDNSEDQPFESDESEAVSS